MEKLLIPILLGNLLWGDCTPQQEQKAINIWKKSIHYENNPKRKINLLLKANSTCPLEVVSVDLNIISAQLDEGTENALSQEALKRLNTQNSSLSNIAQKHIDNNAKKINKLLGMKFDNTLKSLETIGGNYKADLNFAQGSYILQENYLLNDVLNKIDEIISRHKNALFVFEGGASSEGNATENDKLAMNRAEALKKRVPLKYKKHIELFSNGERQLVCEGDFLPEKNLQGEYQCITKEDRVKSRRVSIRRER